MIRALTVGVVLLAAAYGGYWFIAARSADSAAQSAIASMRDAGWQVDYADLATRGFPSRIDMTATELHVAAPDGGFAWTTPRFQVFALSYRPNRIIAAWPETQSVTVAGLPLEIESERLMASAEVGLASGFPLQSLTVEAGGTRLTAEAGWQTGFTGLISAFRPVPDSMDADYDLFGRAEEILMPEPLRAVLDPTAQQPEAAQILIADMEVGFAEKIGGASAPVLTDVLIREARLDWGTVGLTVMGTLTAGPGGVAEGSLDLSLRNWPRLLDMAVAGGVVPLNQRLIVTAALNSLSGGEASFTTEITFTDGMTRIGSLPLGPAPILPFTLPD